MGAEKKGKEFVIDRLVEDFFSKSELSEISDILKAKVSQKVSDKQIKNGTSREQIGLELDDETIMRTRLDILITYGENNLSSSRFLQLLLNLGEFTITIGEFSLSSDIHEKIIETVKDNKSYWNIYANALLNLGELHSRQAQWTQSLSFTKKAFNVFKHNNDLKGCSRCENLFGTIYGDLGEFKKALGHFEKSMSYLEEKKDKILIGKLEINLGIINSVLGNFDKALSFYKRALINFKKLNDLKRIAEIHHNLGMTFMKKNMLSEAISEFDLSINASRDAGFLPTLGITYVSKAYLFTIKRDYLLADAFGDKAMEISYKTNDKLSIAEVYKVKGIIQRNLSNYEMSENYLLTSLRMNKELGNKLNEAETRFELGLLYRDTRRKRESKKQFSSALKYFKKINAIHEVKNIEPHVYSS